eukprot:CAMPEP_0113321844 /NCGR_PEP_ID=MMETSP0010_2-20120614/15190_1 /TAXON_ID=216773 ORGANISM="Corethron hystrix, Strain 308" /NCGR_SAMPLE_ID=MMETSP0010_2 /ASSEMBLY_ACC=CAM_ASM_000155 /LENGTH=217 /DNA_ID=CAMNT_0000180107 /DNA_START=225 /DNA_END=878 /DNA_ORIENTATION=+ /assembly_acc=CAM_ASM_000155
MKKFPDDKFGFSVSHTTRNPRPGEMDGVHYHFSTREKMTEDISNGKFIENADVHGNMYGTSVDSVKTVRNSGKICILDIDVQGVMNVKNSSIRPYYIFISPPSMEVLESRLRSRGTEKEEDIAKRIANSKMELEYGMKDGNFDKIITNDDLDKAFAELVETFVVWYPHLTGESNSDVSPTRRPNFFFLALNLLSVYLRLFVSRIRLHFRKHDAVLPK